jgi:hypothetical protein
VKHLTAGGLVRRYLWKQPGHIEDGEMNTRRMAYWWFWFVVSGRFLDKFLNPRRMRQD